MKPSLEESREMYVNGYREEMIEKGGEFQDFFSSRRAPPSFAPQARSPGHAP
jgi:hypothetical protein